MKKIKEFFLMLKEKTTKLIEKKYFVEIYCAVISFLALFGWLISGTAGMIPIIISAIIVILLTDNFNYVIPQILYIAFTVSNTYYNFYDNIGAFILLAVLCIVFVIILAISVFRRGIKIHKMKSIIPLIGLALFNLLPIFWCNTIGNVEEYQIFYINFFSNLAYLAFYFLICTGIRGNTLKLFCTAASFLGILLSLECAIMVLRYKDTTDNILDLWYSVGWGLCNEAAIMICFSLPFIFYLVSKQKTYKGIIYQLVKSLICLVGILLTTSRGGFLFGALTFGASAIALVFVSEEKKKYRRVFFITLAALCAICLIGIVPLIKLSSKVLSGVFYNGLSLNDRDKIWTTGFNQWTKNPLTVIFGPGWCCAIEPHQYTTNAVDRPEVMCPTVFHSLLMQTLCMGGIIALGFLVYHMVLKYKEFTKFDKPFMVLMIIGFGVLDLYGLIDNTYHMYYFMLPLLMFIAVMDNALYDNEVENNLVNSETTKLENTVLEQ